jgi:hypothetical protein
MVLFEFHDSQEKKIPIAFFKTYEKILLLSGFFNSSEKTFYSKSHRVKTYKVFYKKIMNIFVTFLIDKKT